MQGVSRLGGVWWDWVRRGHVGHGLSRLGAVRLVRVRFGVVRPGWLRFGAVEFGAVLSKSSPWSAPARCSVARRGGVRFGKTRQDKPRFCCVWLGLVRMGSTWNGLEVHGEARSSLVR